MDIFVRGLSRNLKGHRVVANGLTVIRSRWRSVPSFSVVSEYTRTLTVLTDNNLID